MKKEDISQYSTKLVTNAWPGYVELDIIHPPSKVTLYTKNMVTVDGVKFNRGVDYRWHMVKGPYGTTSLSEYKKLLPRVAKASVVMINIDCKIKYKGRNVEIPHYLSSIDKDANTITVYTAFHPIYYYNTNDVINCDSGIFTKTNKILYFKNPDDGKTAVSLIEDYLLNANEILYL